MFTCLLILTIIFFALTLYNIIQANITLFEIQATRWLSLKILDTSSAASLFVTLLGALLVRHQFAIGVLPRISYKSATARKQAADNHNIYEDTWRVEIRNTGLGSAIFYRAEYYLELPETKVSHSYTFHGIINALAKTGLMRDCDYCLENISKGFSLSPKDECFVFEIKNEHIQKLRYFSMALYFHGQLGDKYCREINLIPRA